MSIPTPLQFEDALLPASGGEGASMGEGEGGGDADDGPLLGSAAGPRPGAAGRSAAPHHWRWLG